MIRGRHILALVAILLSAVSVRATELYAMHYQSLPVLDWVESRPPLVESSNLPPAADLVRGLAHVLPLLTISDQRPILPLFGPPAVTQRLIGGVRDASRIQLDSPGTFPADQVPVLARLDVIVFNRNVRAAAWSELMSREMDIHNPENGLFQARLAGPDETDGVWVIQPRQDGGIAIVVGHRGTVAFFLQITLFNPDKNPSSNVDWTARAEVLARQATAEWSSWLDQQVAP